MIKIFSTILRKVTEAAQDESQPRDPMMHPALQAMSERELADLPLSAGYCRMTKEGKCAA